MANTLVRPWWLGLTSDHVYEGCPGRQRSLPELDKVGWVGPGLGDLDPEGGDVCGWCLRVWRARTKAASVPLAEIRTMVAYDWLVSRAWNRLHFAELDATQLEALDEDRLMVGGVRLSCGRTAAYISIPGFFTRMGAPRCTGCCRALGYPQGIGSPKNDDACRALLGLPAMADVLPLEDGESA